MTASGKPAPKPPAIAKNAVTGVCNTATAHCPDFTNDSDSSNESDNCGGGSFAGGVSLAGSDASGTPDPDSKPSTPVEKVELNPNSLAPLPSNKEPKPSRDVIVNGGCNYANGMNPHSNAMRIQMPSRPQANLDVIVQSYPAFSASKPSKSNTGPLHNNMSITGCQAGSRPGLVYATGQSQQKGDHIPKSAAGRHHTPQTYGSANSSRNDDTYYPQQADSSPPRLNDNRGVSWTNHSVSGENNLVRHVQDERRSANPNLARSVGGAYPQTGDLHGHVGYYGVAAPHDLSANAYPFSIPFGIGGTTQQHNSNGYLANQVGPSGQSPVMRSHYPGLTSAYSGPQTQQHHYEYGVNIYGSPHNQASCPPFPQGPQQQPHGGNPSTFDVNTLNGMVNGTDVASNPHGEGVAPRSTKRHSARHNAVFSSTAYGQSARTPAKRTNVVQTQTEPRHFAPQARADVAAGLTQQPPPRFMYSNASFLPATDGAGVAAIQEGFGPGTDTDPFYSPSAQYGGTALPSQNNGVYSNNFMAAVPLGPAPPLSYCVPAPRSPMLMMLTQGPTGLPSKDIALDPEYFPFMNSMTQAQADQYGVVKLKNIPFSARRSDIIAFFGRSSKLVNDRDEPVHIIMERTTSKTQDAYAEFITLAAANEAIEQKRKNRIPRLGDRPVELELSSQSALMKDLFPHADGVYWNGGEPEIQPPKPGVPCTTFKGFVQNEEMTVLVKHVEDPRRSKYSGDCPQRPYECLISIIKKLPWYKSEHITVGQRHAVYKAAMDLIKLLQKQIYRNHRNEGGWVDTSDLLNRQLLKRLVMAAMLCPGFSVLQKDNIALVSGISDEDQRNFNQPRFAKLWTHQLTLCPKPNRPIDVLEWYISIIRENTTSFVNSKPLDDRQPIQAKRGTDNGYFGYLWHEIDFPAGKAYDKMTLEEAARKELAAIELVLRRAFSD